MSKRSNPINTLKKPFHTMEINAFIIIDTLGLMALLIEGT